MKRCLCVVWLMIALLATACVPETAASGGVVVRGQPAPLPSVDYAALASGEALVFITASGKKYHTADCPHLSSPPIALTPDQAAEEGYTPCSRCHPDPK